MNKVQENIAEISMYIGCMIAYGKIPKKDMDLSSSEMSEKITQWAYEFEEKYGHVNFHNTDSVSELGNVIGYLDAIDSYTEIKCRENGWHK